MKYFIEFARRHLNITQTFTSTVKKLGFNEELESIIMVYPMNENASVLTAPWNML
jgi:hypothetical protein